MKLVAKLLPTLTLLFALAGCSLADQRVAAAMEEAIARRYKAVSDFQLLQQVPWQEGGLALVTFDAVNQRDMALVDCYGLGYFRGSFPVYSVFSAISMCGNNVRVDAPEGQFPALETIPYGYLALVQQDTSVAFGRVLHPQDGHHPDGVQVRVVWDDGHSETVEVVNGSYLAPQSGLSEVQEVALLDENGRLLATVTP